MSDTTQPEPPDQASRSTSASTRQPSQQSTVAASALATPAAQRRVALKLNPRRSEAVEVAARFVAGVSAAGIACLVAPEWIPELAARVPGATLLDVATADEPTAPGAPEPEPVEVLVVFGGDGTILRGADWALAHDVPLLGVNLGHVGFLAELEPAEANDLVTRVVERRHHLERRLVLSVTVTDPSGEVVWQSWAVNEVSIEKAARERMVEVLASVDRRAVSRWHCDGVLVSTPTGSTAYAFSAGGPVIWPDVEAMLLVPLSAHALFARPMVLSPHSRVDLDLSDSADAAVVWCDGWRSADVPANSTVSVVRAPRDLLIARLSEQPFATRLVKKFDLPVEGWRNNTPDAGTERATPDDDRSDEAV